MPLLACMVHHPPGASMQKPPSTPNLVWHDLLKQPCAAFMYALLRCLELHMYPPWWHHRATPMLLLKSARQLDTAQCVQQPCTLHSCTHYGCARSHTYILLKWCGEPLQYHPGLLLGGGSTCTTGDISNLSTKPQQ